MSNISAMPHCARLQLTAVTLKNGQYQVLRSHLHWRVRAREQTSNASNLQQHFNSGDAVPLFVLPEGIYDVIVAHTELGEKEIYKIKLKQDTIVDEVVYLGSVDIDDQEENFHLSGQDDFNQDREYTRRQQDRAAQSQFADNADELRAPGLLGQEAEFGDEPGFGQAQQTAAQSGMQAHPLLSQSAQFDGVASKLNPELTQNEHAAEAQVEPSLQPGAKAQPGMSTAPRLDRR